MSNYCVMCGSSIPDDQGSSTCSMCYGDIDHGKDGYYRDWAERQNQEEYDRQSEIEQQPRPEE